MNPIRLLTAPLAFAVRRIRVRPLSALGVAAALAAGGGLIGWTAISAAQAADRSARTRLSALPPAARALRVTYFTVAGDPDTRRANVSSSLREFADVARRPIRVLVSHSVEAGNPLGMRVVTVDDVRRNVRVRTGRLPNGLDEALALTGVSAPSVRLGRITVRIVGKADVRRGVFPDRSELGSRAVLVTSLSPPLAKLVTAHGSTVVVSATLVPDRIRGSAVDDLERRIETTFTRLQRGDPLVRTHAPLAALAELSKRSRVARTRLELVSGEAAALLIAFAGFVAVTRRRESELVEEQLSTFGASRVQASALRWTEHLAAAVVGGSAAIAGTLLAAALADVHVAGSTIVEIVVVVLAGAGLLGLADRDRDRRFGVGALEVTAVTALALIIWQTATTGALDPDTAARSDTGPVIVLVPALAFFVAGVLLLRAVPLLLRGGERLVRAAPTARLALVTAARQPAQAAAATTFLAVAVGASLFSFSYRATIDRQAHDAARFQVGAVSRATGARSTSRAPDAARAIRLDGDVETVSAVGDRKQVRMLALPAADVPRLQGWRADFATTSRTRIARRLRPTRVALTGPRIARDARALRVWARSQTDYPRTIIAHFRLGDDHFAKVEIGTVWRQWRRLGAAVPERVRNAQLVALQYAPTTTPISFKYDPEGLIDLGPLEQRRPAGWTPLPSLAHWTATTLPTGASGLLYGWRFRHAPVATGTRFDVNGTLQPIVHPATGLSDPLPGFQTGAVPALVSREIARGAVDRLLTLDVAGKQVPLRTVADARFFPSVVKSPSRFVVVDYETLFAALNSDQPGVLMPNEAWSFNARLPNGLNAADVESALRDDPLAAGTRTVLAVTGLLAAALALLGLVLAARATVVSERLVLAEYEALGVAPRALRRSAQLRIAVLSTTGLVAALVGAVLATRLIAALVAVTGTARRPLPPISTVIAWPASVGVLATLAGATLVTAALVAATALREPVARRLRA